MYFIRTPRIIRDLFPGCIWNLPDHDKSIYLTFDDGPTPELTQWVLKQLARYEAKATFFCIGEKAQQYPYLIHAIRQAGHSIGSHSMQHESAWDVEPSRFFRSVSKAARLLDTDLFRPPYGRLRPGQARVLSDHYRVVMWDVLSGDFDTGSTADRCVHNVISRSRSGSIVLMHDSQKASANLYGSLPQILDYLHDAGYTMKALDEHKETVAAAS